eukprot:Hpha_TRINITY_DN16658_c3_g10::TRINITY_DN16658_c3_g10_i1::g.183494::m.183494/K11838/USP7, UBP15; ubiquitin carboxyl-terminal hydrolase 7
MITSRAKRRRVCDSPAPDLLTEYADQETWTEQCRLCTASICTTHVGSVAKLADLRADGSAAVWAVTFGLSDSGKRQFSTAFRVGRARWRLMMERGENDPAQLAIFLECETAEKAKGLPQRWCFEAGGEMRLVDCKGRTFAESDFSSHLFGPKEKDRVTHTWGFPTFADFDKALQRCGRQAPHGGTQFLFHVTVVDRSAERAPAKGLTGLQNQGATCYLNSLLQTLFHLKTFRAAMFRLPTLHFRQVCGTGRDATIDPAFRQTMPFALARLFWAMQQSVGATGTRELTRSFGWEGSDVSLQQDVQEMLRKLVDKLDDMTRDTPLAGFIDLLFRGEARNYVRCPALNHSSETTEAFHELQVSVEKGSLEEGLRELLQVEELKGDNKYRVVVDGRDLGLHDAVKGAEWVRFPPVLMLHLRRFQYNLQREAAEKVNDRFTFPEMLDVAPFLCPEAPRPSETPTPLLPPLTPGTPVDGQTTAVPTFDLGPPAVSPGEGEKRRWEDSGEAAEDEREEEVEKSCRGELYRLFAVLVHSGEVSGGHYYAYVRSADGQWNRFDDEKVTRASREQATVENYGGNGDGPRFWLRDSARGSSAYMLVYVQHTRWQGLLSGTNTTVPPELQAVFHQEAMAVEEEEKRKADAPRHVELRVWTDKEVRRDLAREGFAVGLGLQGDEPLGRVRVLREDGWE